MMDGKENRVMITMDPGLVCSGLAVWKMSGELETAFIVRELKWDGFYNQDPLERQLTMAYQIVKELKKRVAINGNVNLFISEIPQFYTAGKSKGDPNKLAPLLGVVTAVAALLDATQNKSYLPARWKGQMDPDKLIVRIKGQLSRHEICNVEKAPDSLAHNLWDAVGIGLYHSSRLFQRVIARQ